MYQKLVSPTPILSKQHPFVLFVVIPVLMNAVLIGLYFSGVYWMQQKSQTNGESLVC